MLRIERHEVRNKAVKLSQNLYFYHSAVILGVISLTHVTDRAPCPSLQYLSLVNSGRVDDTQTPLAFVRKDGWEGPNAAARPRGKFSSELTGLVGREGMRRL